MDSVEGVERLEGEAGGLQQAEPPVERGPNGYVDTLPGGCQLRAASCTLEISSY
jgi:hypothetical protein